MKLLLSLCCLLVAGAGAMQAQADSALLLAAPVPDGLYLSHSDLRHQHPLKKEDIVTSADKEQLEFFSRLLKGETFTFKNGSGEVTSESKNAWGFFQNNTLYVNYRGDFYRVPVFGSISYFVAMVQVVAPGFYDPRFGYSGGGTSYELREFLLNYYNGQTVDFSPAEMERLLGSDPELYARYSKLGRRQQKAQVHQYLRQFNERHPVYFLK